jgi:hypothetical protein
MATPLLRPRSEHRSLPWGEIVFGAVILLGAFAVPIAGALRTSHFRVILAAVVILVACALAAFLLRTEGVAASKP